MSYSYINDAFNINNNNNLLFDNQKTKSDITYSNYEYFSSSLNNNSSNNNKNYSGIEIPYAIENNDSDKKNNDSDKKNNDSDKKNNLTKKNNSNSKLDIFNLNELSMSSYMENSYDNDETLLYSNNLFENDNNSTNLSCDLNGTNLSNLLNSEFLNVDETHDTPVENKLTHIDCINIFDNPEFFIDRDINFALRHISKCNICKKEIIKNKNNNNIQNKNKNKNANTNTNTNANTNQNTNTNTNTNTNANINSDIINNIVGQEIPVSNSEQAYLKSQMVTDYNRPISESLIDNNYDSLYDTSMLSNDEYVGNQSIIDALDTSKSENILNSILLEKQKEKEYFSNLTTNEEIILKNIEKISNDYNTTNNNISNNKSLLKNINNNLNNIIYLLNKKVTNAIENFEISFIHIVSVIIIILLLIDIFIRISKKKIVFY
jgi:hypothetical protein